MSNDQLVLGNDRLCFLLQFWFKNARAKSRRMSQLQKMAYTDHDVQRWRRRRTLRRSINGSPAMSTVTRTSRNQPEPVSACRFAADQRQWQLPNLADQIMTPLPRSETVSCLSTPREVSTTPMPQAFTDRCCYARVPDLSQDLFASKAAYDQTKAFHDSSFKRLFGKLFESLLKDERMI